MKNPFVFFTLLLIIIIFFSSCVSNELKPPGQSAAIESASQDTIQISIGTRPPQPIYFESYDDMIFFLKHPDLSSYSEEDKTAYRNMIDSFSESGYVMRVATKTADISPLDHFFLYPRTAREDSGVAYWYEYMGCAYQVILYHADREVLNTHEGEQLSIKKYLELRHGFNFGQADEAFFELDNAQAFIGNWANGDIYIERFIDRENYLWIRTSASKEELLDFYSLIKFEYIELP